MTLTRYEALKISDKHDSNKKAELANTPEFLVQVSIENNTSYPISITGQGAGNTSAPIKPNSSYSWKSSDTYNTKDIAFNSPSSTTPFMLGSLAFGPLAGVYADRGWMASQSITMVAKVTPTGGETVTFTQSVNGGKTIVPWDGFENGGIIELEFNQQ